MLTVLQTPTPEAQELCVVQEVPEVPAEPEPLQVEVEEVVVADKILTKSNQTLQFLGVVRFFIENTLNKTTYEKDTTRPGRFT